MIESRTRIAIWVLVTAGLGVGGCKTGSQAPAASDSDARTMDGGHMTDGTQMPGGGHDMGGGHNMGGGQMMGGQPSPAPSK